MQYNRSSVPCSASENAAWQHLVEIGSAACMRAKAAYACTTHTRQGKQPGCQSGCSSIKAEPGKLALHRPVMTHVPAASGALPMKYHAAHATTKAPHLMYEWVPVPAQNALLALLAHGL